MDFIEQEVAQFPELADVYSEVGRLFSRKLWHQLTAKLMELVSDPANIRGDNFIRLYTQFITKFDGKLNQLEFVKLVSHIAASFPNPQDVEPFLTPLLEKRNRLGVEATLFIEVLILSFQLKAKIAENPAAPDLKTMKAAIMNKRAEVEGLQGLMDTCVHSAYYKMATEYYKIAGPADLYYQSALVLLAYTPIESLRPEEALELATNMGLAALTADGVYNFGEVLATSMMGVLDESPMKWLADILRCFNHGDINKFNSLVEVHGEAYRAQTVLQLKDGVVKEKLAIVAFMDQIFETPPHERTIRFSAIASRTHLELEQVEWLVMRTMSLGLVKGVIDEVDANVQVTWVQPRVLGADQMEVMKSSLLHWSEKVKTAENFINDRTLDLFS